MRDKLFNSKNHVNINTSKKNYIYLTLLKYFLPIDLCENFIFFNKYVRNNIIYLPNYVFSFSSNRYNTLAAFINAYASINKTKIYAFQHGGGYFMHNNDPFLKEEIKNSDLYFSYGFKRKDVIPFANFNKIIKINRNKKILYITTDIMRGFNKIYESLEGPNFYLYFNFQKNFYSSLNHSIKKNINIKLYNYNFGNDSNAIFDTNSIIKYSSLDENLINQYSLFIIDANQSVF